MGKRGEEGTGQGIVIESRGPDGWTFIGAGFLFGTALVILALALFNLSVYLGWSAVILSSGSSMTCICYGIARVIEARGNAEARATEARGYAKAQEIGAATRHIAVVRGKLSVPEEHHAGRHQY